MTDRFARFKNWKRAGVGVIAVPVPTIAFSPERRWGDDKTSTHPKYPWVEHALLVVPEGFVSALSCSECGGRREGLIDFRELAKGMTDAEKFLAMKAETPMRLAERANDQKSVDAFAAAHAECKARPRCPLASGEIETFYRRGIEGAAQQLKVSGGVTPAAIYLSDQGHAFCVPFPDLPSRTGDDEHDHARRITIAKWHWSTREFLRARNLVGIAVVVIHEGWITMLDKTDESTYYPAKHPKREERVVATLATPDFVRIGMAPIIRKSGKMDEGPGTMGEIIMGSGGSGQGLIDGALATTKASWVPDPFNATGYEL